jgi:hypothetical protein
MGKIKKLLIFVLALFFAVAGVYGYTTVYWHRTISHPIKIIGIDADLLQPTVDGHTGKLVATDLDGNGKIAFTIYQENYYEVWLNISLTTDCPGLVFGAVTGQYYHCYMSSGYGYYEPFGDSFAITPNTMQVIDKLHSMWGSANDGYMLEIQIVWDTELCTTMGEFTADILFNAGFNAA